MTMLTLGDGGHSYLGELAYFPEKIVWINAFHTHFDTLLGDAQYKTSAIKGVNTIDHLGAVSFPIVTLFPYI